MPPPKKASSESMGLISCAPPWLASPSVPPPSPPLRRHSQKQDPIPVLSFSSLMGANSHVCLSVLFILGIAVFYVHPCMDCCRFQALACEPQPECTYFEGWCTYCPAGYKCPQVRAPTSELSPHHKCHRLFPFSLLHQHGATVETPRGVLCRYRYSVFDAQTPV